MPQVREVAIGFFPTPVSPVGVAMGPGEKQHGKMNLQVRNLSLPVLEEVCPEV